MVRRFVAMSSAVLLGALPAVASTVNGPYVATLVDVSPGPGSNTLSGRTANPVIRGDGSLVSSDYGDTSFAEPNEILTRQPDGSVRSIALPGYRFGQAATAGNATANASGRVAAVATNTTTGFFELLLIAPDGTVETLLEADPFSPSPVPYNRFLDIELNDNGEVAANVLARDAEENVVGQILRISPNSGSAPTIEVLDGGRPPTDPDGGRSFSGFISIDDEGRIAWLANEAGESGKNLVNDGTTTEVVFDSNSAPVLNNEGQILTVDGATLVLSDVTDGVPNDADPQVTSGTTPFYDLNDYGQSLQRTQDGRVVLGDETIFEIGETFGNFEAITGGGPPRITRGEALNDSGQIVVETTLEETDENGDVVRFATGVVRLDPAGATPDNPILPDSTAGDVNTLSYEIVNGLGLEQPIYVDPVVQTVFDYELLSGPLFSTLTIPDQDLGDEDGTFEILFGSVSETLSFGEVLDFTEFDGFDGGVSFFTIGGIDPGASVALDDPFVVGLTHASLGAVEMTITGRNVLEGDPDPPSAIPLPGAAWLLLSAFAGLGAWRRRAGDRS